MRVADDFLSLFTRDQEQLGVNFQPRRREDNVDAGFGQTLRPMDIGFFVETRLKLHHHGDFFAVMGCVDHRIDDP